MHPRFIFSVALFCAAAAAGAAPPSPAPNANNESGSLRDAVIVELDGAGVATAPLTIRVDDGRVTLTGTVPRFSERERAEDVVSGIRGVTSVDNQLKVGGAKISDEAIRTSVLQTLKADPASDELVVDVTVTDGVVRLSGPVSSWQERQLITEVAGSAEGVRGIDDQLDGSKKGARASSDDRSLTVDVQERLRWDSRLDDDRIKVDTQDGKVALVGSVNSLFDKGVAIAHAFAAGAGGVDAGALQVRDMEMTKGAVQRKFGSLKAEAIEKAIDVALAVDPRVMGQRIDVTVNNNGVATLTGTVDNLPAKRAAIADARSIAGVARLEDRLTVAAKPLGDPALKDAVAAALNKTPGLEPGEVNVAVDSGKVVLIGAVDSFAEKQRAVDAASGVAGIVAVDDAQLVINRAPKKSMTDQQLAQAIKRQMFWSPYIDADDVQVSVVDGIVQLTGSVDSFFEKEKAAQTAMNAGALRVDNKLSVAATSGPGSMPAPNTPPEMRPQ